MAQLSRIAILAAALALVAAGYAGFAAPRGIEAVEFWWLACLGLALIPVAATIASLWQMAGLMTGLFVAGFAAQLAVRDPLWFQHIRVFPSQFSYIQMGVVALQGLIGAVVLLYTRPFAALARIGAGLGWIRVTLMAVLLVLASKSAMDFIAGGDLARYPKQLFVSLVFLGANLVSLAAIAVCLPKDALQGAAAALSARLALPGQTATAPTPLDRRLPWIVAGFVTILTAAISFFAFEAVPHLDGIVYLFHARYFSHGLISLPVPVDPDAFGHYLMDTAGEQWFSVNLPGWPAAQAISLWFGAPWLLNPILAGVSVLLLHRFVTVQADRGLANLVVLMLAVSPWYLSMSSTLLLHTFTYALILGAWVLLQNARNAPGWIGPLVAGCLMGWLFLSRPLEGAYMGVLTGIWTLSFLWLGRVHWRTVILYGLGCLVIGLMFFAYNSALTGSPMLLPMDRYIDTLWGPGTNGIGFGPEKGPNPGWGNVDALDGHSPVEALINAHQNLFELNAELLGWAGASVFFAAAFLFWGRWSALTGAMAVIIVVTLILYSAYWYVGGFYAGPRYWFLMLVPMLIFSALGIRVFAERLETALPGQLATARLGAVIVILGLCSVALYQNWLSFNKYPGINGYHADYQDLSRRSDLQNALIFVTLEKDSEFGSAFWLNDFAPGATTPLFARDVGAERNLAIAQSFPDRAIWFVEGRSKSNQVVAITAGPISLDEMEQGQ